MSSFNNLDAGRSSILQASACGRTAGDDKGPMQRTDTDPLAG
jgi:hypothetical protein